MSEQENGAQRPELTITESNKLVVHFAPLPVTGTYMEYLTAVKEPIELAPVTHKITLSQFIAEDELHEKTFKKTLLASFKTTVIEAGIVPSSDPRLAAFLNIEEVELVACDLLTPKAKRN
jgi:hypothetical protein